MHAVSVSVVVFVAISNPFYAIDFPNLAHCINIGLLYGKTCLFGNQSDKTLNGLFVLSANNDYTAIYVFLESKKRFNCFGAVEYSQLKPPHTELSHFNYYSVRICH